MKKKDEYIRLIGFVKPHLGVLAIAAICMLMYSLLNSVVIPGGIIPVVENILSGKEISLPGKAEIIPFLPALVDKVNSLPKMKLIGALVISFLLYFFFRNLFDFLKVYFMNDVSQRVIRDVKNIIYDKLLSLSMYFYSQHSTAKLMSRITYDAAIIRDSISQGLLDLIQQPFEILAYLTMAMCVAIVFAIPIGFLLTIAILLPMILLPAIIIGRRLRKITTRSQEKMGSINMTLFETISGIRIVKAFSMQDYESEKFKKQNQDFFKLAMKSVKRNNIISPLNEWTASIYLGIVVYAAARQVVSGRLAWGPFAAFAALILLLLRPLKRLGKIYAVNQQALSAATRIFEVLDTCSEIVERERAIKLWPIRKDISFEDVWFKYEKQGESKKEEVLKGINLRVNAGEVVAIVGLSGVGKTTLVNLIPRFYDVTKGRVTIDGIDLRDVTLKSLRDQIGIVTQEMLLFNDTVTNNITYGSECPSQEDIVKAAKTANAHDFVVNMPDGYDTVIGERGFRISGGERQRIAIARAIFKNPPILILDEATSQLDTESERLVQEALERLMRGRTVLVIAHRLSTVRHADKIIVLDKGRIADSGIHAELIERDGLYKRLYDMQFTDESSPYA